MSSESLWSDDSDDREVIKKHISTTRGKIEDFFKKESPTQSKKREVKLVAKNAEPPKPIEEVKKPPKEQQVAAQ